MALSVGVSWRTFSSRDSSGCGSGAWQRAKDKEDSDLGTGAPLEEQRALAGQPAIGSSYKKTPQPQPRPRPPPLRLGVRLSWLMLSWLRVARLFGGGHGLPLKERRRVVAAQAPPLLSAVGQLHGVLGHVEEQVGVLPGLCVSLAALLTARKTPGLPGSSTSHHWTCRTISSSMWYLTAKSGPSCLQEGTLSACARLCLRGCVRACASVHPSVHTARPSVMSCPQTKPSAPSTGS